MQCFVAFAIIYCIWIGYCDIMHSQSFVDNVKYLQCMATEGLYVEQTSQNLNGTYVLHECSEKSYMKFAICE